MTPGSGTKEQLESVLWDMDAESKQEKRISRLIIANVGLCLILLWVGTMSCFDRANGQMHQAMFQMNTDLQAIVYHLESPEEAEHRLRNYDKVERRTDNLNDHADLDLWVRDDQWHGWIQGYIQYKDGKPVSFLVTQVFPMP
jgi:hypothetical protein